MLKKIEILDVTFKTLFTSYLLSVFISADVQDFGATRPSEVQRGKGKFYTCKLLN